MNNKGQAFIESILLLGIATIACLFLIRLGLHLQNEILIDELVEETLICKLQKKQNCVNQLKNKLYSMNFKSVEVADMSQVNKAHIKLQAVSGLNFKSLLESELFLELQVN